MASEGYKWALGLMSGTSLDGVDVAMIETDGERVRAFGPSMETPFDPDVRAELERATQVALRWAFDGPMPNSLALATELVDGAHIAAVERFARRYPDDFARVSLIGYHGQTVLHDPPRGDPGRTLQLGTGQVLADRFGLPVVWDFRSADMAAGGQGAPLAPAYHRALVEAAGLQEDVAVLNLGGVGNITTFSPLAASDCGPGNGPLDLWMMATERRAYDHAGAFSLDGVPDFALVHRWLAQEFFTRDLPRSADRYQFDVLDAIDGMSTADGAATLCAFTAMAAAATARELSGPLSRIIVCGGGRHNHALMRMLAEEFRTTVCSSETLGWDGDALEAQAFAFLAVRSLRGLPLSYPGTTGVAEPMTGGRVAHPRATPPA